LLKRQEHIRSIIKTTVDKGIPMPAFMSSLSYFDAYRSERLPTNLIQAQRDYFGAHTYERIDQQGTFHTEWSE
jgi:6-phosphogluconate dehydrogenase